LDCFERALRIVRATGDVQAHGTLLCDMAITYREDGRFDEAIRCSEQGAQLAESAGDLRVASNALSNLGMCSLYQGRGCAAEPFFRQGLEKANRVGVAASRSYNLRGLARCCILQGQHKDALRSLQEAKQIGHHHGRHEVAFLLGLAYLGLHNQDLARTSLDEAKSRCNYLISHYIDHYDALLTLAVVTLALGDHKQAMECYAKTLAVNPPRGVVQGALHDLALLQSVRSAADVGSECRTLLRRALESPTAHFAPLTEEGKL